jgi:hypothetical protein
LRVGQHLGQGRDVAQAEVQALSGDGMNAMGRVAHEREARGDEGIRDAERERVAVARAGKLDLAEEIAECGAERLEIGGVVHRRDLGGARGAFGPDDGGSVAGQGQDRERSGGMKNWCAMPLCGFSWAMAQTSAVCP